MIGGIQWVSGLRCSPLNVAPPIYTINFAPTRGMSVTDCIPPHFWCQLPTVSPFFLSEKKTCLLVTQEDMSSCDTKRHVFLWHNNRCRLLTPEEMFSCDTRTNVFLRHKKTLPLVSLEDISSCVAGRHFFLCHKKTFLLVSRRGHFFLFHRRAFLLV